MGNGENEVRHVAGGAEDITRDESTSEDGIGEADFGLGWRDSALGLVQVFPRALSESPCIWITSGSRIVGRSSGAGIQLNDPQVSRFHTRIISSDSCLRIWDLGSRHGTRVDGIPCDQTERRAEAGSLLRLGNTLLLVVTAPLTYGTPAKRPEAISNLPPNTLAGPTLSRVWGEASEVARSTGPVLIVGERGTDKEALARLIHGCASPEQPFCSLDLASLPAESVKAELTDLFSRARGASNTQRGTLFVEGVESLANAQRAELLSLIEQGSGRKSAASDERRDGARVILAVETACQTTLELGHLRADLRGRLQGFVIEVPPLRARRDEVILAALVAYAGKKLEPAVYADTAELLALSSWDGNDHELRQALFQATRQVAESGTFVRADHLPVRLKAGNRTPESTVEVRAASYTFRDFEVDAEAFELRRNGETVPLQPRVFDLLLYLVRSPNRVVTRDELLKGPWKGTSVVHTALNQAIMLLRRAIDEGEGPSVIRTIRQRGFQFDATVSERVSDVSVHASLRRTRG